MPVEKMYQVFVSSTFLDLKEERQAVIKAVLQLNCMPAGMELFPAADVAAWQLIQNVIATSDFYVLIIGGRYGSEDDEGVGFTEKEYEYAKSSGKPVLAFLHEDPDSLPRARTDRSEEAWAKLEVFRNKIDSKHTRSTWRTPIDLAAQVILAPTHAKSTHSPIGWVRADQVPSEATMTEVLKLQELVANLKNELDESRIVAPQGTENLLQGADLLEFDVGFRSGYDEYTLHVASRFDDLFAAVSPKLLIECHDHSLRSDIRAALLADAMKAINQIDPLPELRARNVIVNDSVVDTVLVQMNALQLIRESTRRRSVTSSRLVWELTPYGRHKMTMLRALPRP